MTRYGLNVACLGVTPKGVGATFTLEITSVSPEVFEKSPSFHPTVTTSRVASSGTPRSASSRRSSRIRLIASDKL